MEMKRSAHAGPMATVTACWEGGLLSAAEGEKEWLTVSCEIKESSKEDTTSGT